MLSFKIASMNEKHAIFELIALFIAPPLTILVGGIIRKFFKSTIEQDLYKLFHRYWDGQNENELYAWQMVKNQILNSSRDPIKLKRVEEKIESCRKSKLLSKIKVTSDGKFTD
jgi:hypothetical protein